MLIAALLLAAAPPGQVVHGPAIARWRIEHHPEGCLATGFSAGDGTSVSLIFATAPRTPSPPDATAPVAVIDGTVLPDRAPMRVIVAYDGRNWREESEADQSALLALLPHARQLQLRRPEGQILVTVPIASVAARAGAIAACAAAH